MIKAHIVQVKCIDCFNALFFYSTTFDYLLYAAVGESVTRYFAVGAKAQCDVPALLYSSHRRSFKVYSPAQVIDRIFYMPLCSAESFIMFDLT